ncbi:hypothetical protein COCVIDRAFT_35908 [Bipolaris victoriae FI3]|uniref:Cytochrome P450 n=1 Tax=Bipolaris victoriae (strain FI3) TaxID=930091 RepID=W7EFB9_BIPV3|nr:hypothetical protein COCVIDRAFT_35908 [Bipolaris victoriae FI3]
MGGADWIWVNTASAAKELMDKRGSNHTALNFNPSTSYKPVQDVESKQSFYDINHRYSASIVIKVVYGHRVPDQDDPFVKKIYEVLHQFTLMSEPGKWLVNAFPSLTILLLVLVQNWWKIGGEWFEYDREVYLKLYRDLVKQILEGSAPERFIQDFYKGGLEKSGISEEQAAYAAGGLIEAGSESTSTVINAWILVFQAYPHVVAAAQQELDRVVESDRLPTYDDEDSLPYIRVMIKETLRFWPITKPGMSHASTEDDWYDGYFIPKGSVVMLNWAIHYDENRWENPYTYDPTRFLSDSYISAESMNLSDGNLRDHSGYSARRRICSGMHLAQNSLYISMARTLWAFNIKCPRNETGREIEPKIVSDPGFLNVSTRFQAVLEPRNQKHADIVEKEWLVAKADGDSPILSLGL